ncbi:MAG: DUF4105 domain-containing protein [Desulfobacteraceae bacterium]|nr:DUF4105 domain-containing protein [Desulfobacteraceae bacterium]MBC2755785.1 DUF4105 domain-containing protein [Desulfobacteraceae bacterium]
MIKSEKIKRSQNILWRLFFFFILSPLWLWGTLSLLFGSWPITACATLSVFYIFTQITILLMVPVKRIFLSSLLLFMIPLISWFLMAPSHDRKWQPDVAKMPYAEFEEDKIIVHNVRNNDYISEADFEPRFETRIYRLSELRSVDLFLTDWGLGHIAHTMISFGFDNNRYLCLSIETRKEEGESYSALRGFFRQYELIYILADERDLVRLRTNFRKDEDVYLYRIRIASLDRSRQTLLKFLNRINDLHKNPEWYNALSENCMTSAFRIVRKNAAPGRGKWHWSVILNGYADENAYKNGIIDTSLPFDRLKQTSRINERAMAAGNSIDFSAKIRNGLPGMNWMPPKGE